MNGERAGTDVIRDPPQPPTVITVEIVMDSTDFRRRGKKVGLIFWQQSLGEEADVIVSPAPIH